MIGHIYTDEQIDWLKANRPPVSAPLLSELFNKKFDTRISPCALRQACQRRGIKSLTTSHFAKGQTPWNAGKKGYMGSNRTSFKPGAVPPNHKPVNTERRRVDGFIEVKISEGMFKWRKKQRVIWEQHNGEIPPRHVIVFLDSDRLNCDISNLAMITRGELAVLNKQESFKAQSPEIKKSLIAVVRVEMASRKIIKSSPRKS